MKNKYPPALPGGFPIAGIALEYRPSRHAAQVRPASREGSAACRSQAGFLEARRGRMPSCLVLLIPVLNMHVYLLCIFPAVPALYPRRRNSQFV